MICQRCLFRLQRSATPLARRSYAAAATIPSKGSIAEVQATPSRGPATEEHEGRPAATSTSAAQPFSSTQHPAQPDMHSKAPALGPSGSVNQIESMPRKKSILEAGQPMRGLGYFKNKDPPVALADNEYPPWLWSLLDFGSKGSTDAGNALDGNVFSKSKAQRRKAVKAAKKRGGEDPDDLLPKVPIDHQTIDLPGGDGTVQGAIQAGEVREDLRGAMRVRRRKDIKTRNYLQGMR